MVRELTANYEVQYIEAAKSEARKLFKKPEQYLFCVQQAKLLRFWPERSGSFQGEFFNLDIKRIEDYWELRVWDKILEHVNIRIMFAVFSHPKAIVVLCAYAKKEEKTKGYIKQRCRHRMRKLIEQGYRP